MATKKTTALKVGGCYIISKDPNANPKIGAKLLKNGMESLFLDFYYGFNMVYDEKMGQGKPQKIRERKSLKLYLYHKPSTPIQRQDNKDILILAEKIRYEKAQELLEQERGYRVEIKQAPLNFISFFQDYINDYTKKDKRVIQMAYNRFIDFLTETREYNKYAKARNIKPQHIDRDMIQTFTEYLQHRSTGEGAKTIYKRFKKVYKAMAVKYNFNYQAPFIDADGKAISIKVDDSVIIKDFLSPNEIKQLIATHYKGENQQIRSAFIFCLNTGLRYCDVKDLCYSNIDEANRVLTYEQNKTKGHSNHSKVTIPLSDKVMDLIGNIPNGNKDVQIFTLPSHTMCLKALRRWVKLAGIDKHITWHCARHSYGTNLAQVAADYGYSIRLVQESMGHSSLKYTERYTRVVDKQKKDAMQQLSKLMED